MFIRITFLLLLCCTVMAGDLLSRADLSYRPEFDNNRHRPENLSLKSASEMALRNSNELIKVKEDRDAAAKNIDNAVNSLLPEIMASASANNLDKTRPDYAEKAAEDNLNAKIKLKQTLFSESVLANKTSAEYEANARRLAAEALRLDIIRQTADTYYSVLMNRHLLSAATKAKQTGSVSKADINKISGDINLYTKNLKDLYAKLSGMTGLEITGSCSFEEPLNTNRNDIISQLTDIFLNIKTDRDYKTLENFFTEKAMQDSAELKALDELIMMSRRTLAAEKRKYILPDISVSGEYTQYLEKGEKITDYSADFSNNDWSLNFRLSMPFFDGKKTSPELYAKNTELMQSYHRRAQIKDAVGARMKQALKITRLAAEKYKTAKAANQKNTKKKTGLLSLYNAETEIINARYTMFFAFNSLQRAYGKFFVFNQNHDDIRFIQEVRQALVISEAQLHR